MKRTFDYSSALVASLAVAGWLFATPAMAQRPGSVAAGGEPGTHAGAGGGGGGAATGMGGGSAISSGGSSSGGGMSGGGTISSAPGPGNMAGGAHAGGRDFSVGGGSHERGGGSGQVRSGGQSRGGRAGTQGGTGAVGRRPMGGSSTAGGGGTTATGSTVSGGGRAVTRGTDARANDGKAGSGNAIPPYSRPRGDRPTTGTAVPRTTPPPPHDGTIGIYGYPWYYPWGFGGLGFYGLYDPWYDPWGYGPGYYDPGYYDPGYYDPSYYGGGQSSNYGEEGKLRLKVKPREAQVFVDGNYVGVVDDFDGVFQRLHVQAGPHRIEIRAPGCEPMRFDVRVETDQTLTFTGELKRIQ